MMQKLKSPRVWLDLLQGLAAFLTSLSALTYAIDWQAMPPGWKEPVFKISSIATLLFQVIRPFLPSPHVVAPTGAATASPDSSAAEESRDGEFAQKETKLTKENPKP